MGRNVDIAKSLLNPGDLTRFEEENRIYLECPYAEKDRVKALGAMWDRAHKKWYIPSGVDPSPFKRWIRARKTAPQKQQLGTIGGFLIGKKKGSAHLWDGVDTVCRMYSTGGMSRKKKTVSQSAHGRPICSMCLAANKNRRDPVLFRDEEYLESKDNFVVQLQNI